MAAPTRPLVLVTGDIILDRHVYEGSRSTLQNESVRGTRLVEEPGGAALTERLIQAVFAADLEERRRQWEEERTKPISQSKLEPSTPACVFGCRLPANPGAPWPERLTAYASWAPHRHPTVKDLFWRASKALGYGALENAERAAGPATAALSPSPEALAAADNLPAHPDIVVLDDAGDRFRRRVNRHVWHLPLGEGGDTANFPTWIVLKLGGSLGRGDLWDHLMQCEPEKRLILLVSAQLLRQDDVRLSHGLSWERTAEHLRAAWANNPVLAPLRRARHVIVTFEGDGAVWIDGAQSERPAAHLVFDAAHVEGEWASKIGGKAFGYQTALAAAVVHSLGPSRALDGDPDFHSAIERALSAMRSLRVEGHGVAVSDKDAFHRGRGFPVARLAGEILHPSHRFARAAVPWEITAVAPSGPGNWSVLASLQNRRGPARSLYGFARQLAIHGESVLGHVPHLRIGKYLTAGRDEMEALRSLRRIIDAYRRTGSSKTPLSVGVFGAPGAGKSFAVEQLAIGLLGDPDRKSYDGWMVFNLSQFDTAADLIGAFHQVRDRVLQGPLPVVFWDEFDTRAYHWLPYLLAPMQDGRFQEGQITHTLGKCVFVFAGGTAATFEDFGPLDDNEPAQQQFTLAKGPDFKSRLDGYLNIVGPDPSDEADIFFPVRRALMIRNFLGCGPNERLDIDAGLLTALLEIPAYRHGARSLGKILEPMSAARRATGARVRRSQLAAPNQLAIHMDNADQFHALCTRDLAFKSDDAIKKLAPAIHNTWRAIARQEGRTPRYDVPYEELPADIKRSNEAAARRIPDILALVGLQVVPGSSTAEEEGGVRDQLSRHLEALAEEEHKGWMAHLEAEGWRFAESRNDDQRLHDCLRPFQELREADKDKDRNSVRHFPDFVRLAGFKIAFI